MMREDLKQGTPRGPWMDLLAWLAVAGAALLTYANQTPWAWIKVTLTQPGQRPSTSWAPIRPFDAIYSQPSPIFGPGPNSRTDAIVFLWVIASLSGIVLALAMAIWRRSRLAAYAYLVWPVAATGGVSALVYAIFGRPPQSLCQINCSYIVWGGREPASGAWLALVGVALLWTGGVARMVSLHTTGVGASRAAFIPALRSLVSPARLGALVTTLGIAVWFFGFIFTPWATQGCTGFPVNWSHFVSGACAGLDSDEILVYATPSGFGSGSFVGAAEMYILLAMLAALIAIWQRGWIPRIVSLVWAASATWLTAMTVSGIPIMLKHPQHFNFSTAPWVVGYGPALTVVGAVIVWAGVASLWAGALLDMEGGPARAE